jgi:hypothetical protein
MRVISFGLLPCLLLSPAWAQAGNSYVTGDGLNRSPAVTLHCVGANNLAVPCGTQAQPLVTTSATALANAATQSAELQSAQAQAASLGTPQDPAYTGGAGSLVALLKGVIVSLSNGVTATPAGGTVVSRSLSLSATTSTPLFPVNAARRYLAFQVPSGTSVWVNFVGGTAGPGATDCVQLSAGTLYESGTFVTHGAVSIYAPVATTVSAWEG